MQPTAHAPRQVHENGHLVSLGSLKGGSLNIYDMRYAKVSSEAPQMLRLHEGDKRVLTGAFWGDSTIVSIGTDNKFVVTDYKLNATGK